MLAGCNRVSEEARDEREREKERVIYLEWDLGWEDYGLEFCRVLI
jgi:hypothetical protein